jgi:predicted acetyltransferase
LWGYGHKKNSYKCNKDNSASAKTIIANGGVFENEVIEDNGAVIQRFWIEL